MARVRWWYVPSDPQQAEEFFRTAALQGSADALFGLGFLHSRRGGELSDPFIAKAVNLARLYEASSKNFDDVEFCYY